ncbi:MAG: ATP-binding protein [Actinomycetota bacterium]|nr:ATP-binding protein [Actinomycetota bacterium]
MNQGKSDHEQIADEALRLYRRLVENSGVGLFQTGTDGTIIWVNEAAARIVGYDSPGDFMANVQDIREIYVDPSRRDDFRREIERHGSVTDFEYEIYRRDGAHRWIAVSAQPMMGPDGSFEGFEGTVTDVTEKKLLRAALEAVSSRLDPNEAISRFADVLRRVIPYDQLTLAVIEGDHYRRMVSISEPTSRAAFPPGERVPLAGNSMDEVIRSQRDLVVLDTSEGKWSFDRVLLEQGVMSYAIFPLLDDTGVFATFNIGSGRHEVFDSETLSLLRSITGAVANAVKNILLFERERAAFLRMEELDQLKKDLFAWVSHDLRSPLTIIKGSAEVAHEYWDRLDENEKRERLRVIVRQAHRMDELLRRDLEVALIEAGELTCKSEPFDLAALVRRTVNDLATSHISRTFDLAIPEDPPWAMGDRDRNLQVLGNLLSNAVKFSPEGSEVGVQVIEEDQSLRVDVLNEGSGIEADRLEEIFNKMYRIEHRVEGTGLGLYISRYLIEAQGGRIWASSVPGQQTCFSFTLPTAGDSIDSTYEGVE